jgi:hypothetical protein
MTLAFPTGESFAIGVVGYEYRPATSHETTPRLVLEVEIEGILAEAVVDTGGVYLLCHPEIARRLFLTPTEALSGIQTILFRGVGEDVTIQRRFPRGKIDQHFWVFQRSSRILEDHRETPQPRNRLARLVESGCAQDRVVAALVEGHDDPFRLDCDHTTDFHAFALQVFGRSRVKAAQLLGQPAIATLG